MQPALQLIVQFHAPVYAETVNIPFKRYNFIEDFLLLNESSINGDLILA